MFCTVTNNSSGRALGVRLDVIHSHDLLCYVYQGQGSHVLCSATLSVGVLGNTVHWRCKMDG